MADTGVGLTADPLLPRPPGGLGPGALLALAVHGLLLVALAWSVNWHARTPEVYSAELWSSLPQVAAPRAAEAPPPPAPAQPTPPPPPNPEPPPARAVAPPAAPAPPAEPAPDPQIAIEKAAKAVEARREAAALAEAEKQAQKARAEADRQARQAKADALRERQRQDQAKREAAQREREAQALKAEAAEDARLAKLREDNLRRMREQMGAPDAAGLPTATGQAARDAAPSASYAGKVAQRIRDNIILTAEVPGNPLAVVELKTGPGGTVVGHRLLKSSGNKEWDEAVLRSVERTDSLPRDTDGRVPPTLELSLRPKE